MKIIISTYLFCSCNVVISIVTFMKLSQSDRTVTSGTDFYFNTTTRSVDYFLLLHLTFNKLYSNLNIETTVFQRIVPGKFPYGLNRFASLSSS